MVVVCLDRLVFYSHAHCLDLRDTGTLNLQQGVGHSVWFKGPLLYNTRELCIYDQLPLAPIYQRCSLRGGGGGLHHCTQTIKESESKCLCISWVTTFKQNTNKKHNRRVVAVVWLFKVIINTGDLGDKYTVAVGQIHSSSSWRRDQNGIANLTTPLPPPNPHPLRLSAGQKVLHAALNKQHHTTCRQWHTPCSGQCYA